MRFHPVPLCATLLLASTQGCAVFSPPPASYASIEQVRPYLDMATDQATKMPHYVPVHQRILMYLPNRLLDVIDVVKVAIGAGPGFGVEVYVSENVWASYLNYRAWRLGLDGRAAGLWDEGHFRSWRLNNWHLHNAQGELSDGRVRLWSTSNLRPFEAPLYDGVPAVPEVPRNTWDIGAQLHFLIGAEVLVRPFELVDLLVGLWGDDIAQDDYGLRDYPLHEYAPQANIVELFVNAIDMLDAAELRKVLSADLVKTSIVRSGGGIVHLDGVDESRSATGGAPPVGDTGKDFVLIDGIRLTPANYRDESGKLDFDARCTGAVLRWGYPAQFHYSLRLNNRYVRSADEYRLVLELEQTPYQPGHHWVIVNFDEVPGELD